MVNVHVPTTARPDRATNTVVSSDLIKRAQTAAA